MNNYGSRLGQAREDLRLWEEYLINNQTEMSKEELNFVAELITSISLDVRDFEHAHASNWDGSLDDIPF